MRQKIKSFSERLNAIKNKIKSEESTKQSMILPFIQLLGYDIFDPEEVTPEVYCGLGKDKGERIDYTININNKPSILIECKQHSKQLEQFIPQLERYFASSPAKIAILTDGEYYLMFSDFEKINLMDKYPFLSFKITDITDKEIEFINLLTKDNFDLEKLYNISSSLFYSNKIRKNLFDCFNYPPDKWIKLLCEDDLKEALNKYGFSFFRKLIKSNIKDVANNIKKIEDEEFSYCSQGDFTSEEIRILDILNSWFITIEELKGNIDYTKLSNGMIRINFLNQWWNICRIKWGPETKYILLCKDSHASETTKHPLKSLEDLYLLKDKIIATALETRLYCLNWRETHN